MSDLPNFLNKQVASRMRLLRSMQKSGALNTELSFLKIPMMLVTQFGDSDLSALHVQLKRTRLRNYTFGLNGRIFIVPRKDAIALVVTELGARKL